MTSYLITGGAGFIGSHLSESLLDEGNKVYSIDNLSTGNLRNIESLRKKFPENFKHESFTLEENEARLSELIDLADTIFHFAAAVGVKNVVENPTHTLQTNLQSTELVLRHASKKNKRVFIASTSEVYGKGAKNGPFKETDDLILGPTHNSRWGYAVSKLADEHLALAFHRQKNLPVTVVRFFNTVGPRQVGNYGMVLPRFISWALKNEPIQVYGDGEQSRCFCYVGDTIRALKLLEKNPNSIGEIYNIGNNEEITMNKLAELVKKITGSSSEIKHIPYEKAYNPGFEDMKRRIPNIEKIKNSVGWIPEVETEKIIKITSEWFRSQDFN